MTRLSLLLLTVGGCAPSAEPPFEAPTQRVAPSESRPVGAATPSHVTTVDWQAALDAERLGEPVAMDATVDLPVLLLEASATSLVQDELWYAASYAFPTHNLVVEGRRMAFSDPVDGDFPEPTWDKPRVTSTHYIFDATFVAWQVSYTVSLECRRPHENPLCADDAAVLAAVKGLKLADSPALKEVMR